MTKRLKLKRIEETKSFKNVIDGLERNSTEKTNDFFEYEKDAILELGCGKGTYTVELAKLHPNKLFMGVDIQGERLWYGAKQSEELNLENVLFLRAPIETLEEYVPEDSVSEIWITFPDPFPSEGKAKKRLTSKRFLDTYKKILKKDGIVNLKTDDLELFEYSLQTMKDNQFKVSIELRDIHNSYPYNTEILIEELKIITPFELKHINANKKIYFAKFKKNSINRSSF